MPNLSPKLVAFSHEVVEIMPLILREFGKREHNDLVRGNITFPQMITLHYLSQKHHIKMSELAKILFIKLSSTTVIMDRLVQQKMVERTRDEEDRRVVWMSITPKGRKVISKIMEEKRHSIREIFKALSEKERTQYLSVLRKVRDHILA